MTRDRDIGQVLEHWLIDGTDEMPDRVYQAIFDRVERQPQAVRPRLVRRLPAMNYPIRPLAGAAAVIVIGLFTISLLSSNRGSVGGPSAPPTATPTATPTVAPALAPLPNPEVDLAPGRYFALAGAHRVTFVVPDGWRLIESSARGLSFVPIAGPKGDTVRVFYDMRPASRDPKCPEVPEAQGSRDISSSGNLISQVASTPGVVATVQKAFPVDSTVAVMTDLSLDPAWTRTCPFSDGQPTVPLIVDTDTTTAGPFWGLGPRERERLVAFDVDGWSNVVIVVDSVDGTTFETLVRQAMPFVQSLEVDASS